MLEKMKKDNKGFTLVELIVVIAILAVLAAVLVPQYVQYIEKSRISADQSAVQELAHAMELTKAADTDNKYSDIEAKATVKSSGTTIEVTAGTARTDYMGELVTALKLDEKTTESGGTSTTTYTSTKIKLKSKAYTTVYDENTNAVPASGYDGTEIITLDAAGKTSDNAGIIK